MNEKILKYLYDVKLAIDEIASFFIDNENSVSCLAASCVGGNGELRHF